MQPLSINSNSPLSNGLYNRFTLSSTPNLAPPAGIIPMHNHPRPTMPQETQRRWNALANVGVALAIISATFLALSPLKFFQQFIQKNVSPRMWQRITKNGTKKLSARGWQLVGIAGVLQGINRFETASNTNQPSKIIAALINTAQMLGFAFFKFGWIAQSWTFVKGALLYAGERNDIENSNHPDLRREWDVSRLTQPLLKGDFSKLSKETGSALRFVFQDLHNAFSLEHWKSLKDVLHYKKSDWVTPQSYQSALGTQSSLIAFLTTYITKLIPGIPNIVSKPLEGLAIANNFFGASIPQAPLVMRAWENRDQIDGKLVLLGSPLIVAGRVFQMSNTDVWKSIGGVGPVGDSVKGKGLALNSQKYLALLNEMRNIQLITQRDPYVTASTILNMMATSPDVMDRLRLQMGQSRLDFLIQLLKQAQFENQQTGKSLNTFLEPILETQDHDNMPFPTKKQLAHQHA